MADDDLRRAARQARARQGWIPPGPVPPGDRGDPDLMPRPEESLDALCGHFRVFQRRDGHRYTTDDLLCAWFAAEEVAREGGVGVRDVLDLGTGVGSVALMVAWRLAEATVVGVEAQPVSVELARRSIRWNGLEDRCSVIEGDLRDPSLLPPERRFDLVTGNPPYLSPGSGSESQRPQRGGAMFAHRGGVEGYVRAAALRLRGGGLLALVFDARGSQEVVDALDSAGLCLVSRLLVAPREGRSPFVELFAARRGGAGPRPPTAERPLLTVRTADGQWTPEYRRVRRDMGFPYRA